MAYLRPLLAPAARHAKTLGTELAASAAALATSTRPACLFARLRSSAARTTRLAWHSAPLGRAGWGPSFRPLLCRHGIRRSDPQTEAGQPQPPRGHFPADSLACVPSLELSQVRHRSRRLCCLSFCHRLVCHHSRRSGRLLALRKRKTALARPAVVTMSASRAASKHSSHHVAESRNFARDAPPQQERVAIVVQPKSGGEPQRPPARQVPRTHRCKIMCSILQAKTVAVSQSAIHLGTNREILPAESASFRGSFQREWTAGAERVTKLPRLVGQILFRDDVLRKIPAVGVVGKDQFQFYFAFVFSPC